MLIEDIQRYLALRRSLGFKLEQAAEYLEWFARFATDKGERHIRAQTAIEWAQTAPTPGATVPPAQGGRACGAVPSPRKPDP